VPDTVSYRVGHFIESSKVSKKVTLSKLQREFIDFFVI